jgi:hypothetical protein
LYSLGMSPSRRLRRHVPATLPDALRDLVEDHPRKFADTAFAPQRAGQVLTRSAIDANALGKLVSPGHRADGHRQAPQ